MNDTGTPRGRTRAASRSLFLPRLVFWLVLLAGVVVQLRDTGDTVNADGIHYIELAQRAASGQLDFASNGYWSPLYPALIAAALAIARPLHLDALVVARGVNVAVIVLCALAFEWLLAALERSSASRGSDGGAGFAAMRRGSAYALFLWGVLRLQHAATVTPDLLVWATLSCTTGFLLRRQSRPLTTGEAVVFGAVLGAGYLAKAVLFPVGLVALAVYAAMAWRRPDGVMTRAVVPTALAFLVVVTPLVAAQTRAQGRLSFGETGRLNYRWYVSHVGEPRSIAEPVAVTARRGEANPAAVSLDAVHGAVLYAGEQRGSFPHGFDPSRSERRDGATTNVASQARVLRQNLYWFWVVGGSLTLFALLPIVLAALDRITPRVDLALPTVPSLALLGLYFLTHVEGRLCGPAIVTLVVVLAYAARPAARTVVRRLQLAALVGLTVSALLRTFNAQAFAHRGGPTQGQGDVAQSAAANGLRPGETIAVIGSPFGHYWVHLAGLRIAVVVALPDAEHPLALDALERLVAESCARGTRVDGVVWQTSDPAVPNGVRRMAAGWRLWRPTGRCGNG